MTAVLINLLEHTQAHTHRHRQTGTDRQAQIHTPKQTGKHSSDPLAPGHLFTLMMKEGELQSGVNGFGGLDHGHTHTHTHT